MGFYINRYDFMAPILVIIPIKGRMVNIKKVCPRIIIPNKIDKINNSINKNLFEGLIYINQNRTL